MFKILLVLLVLFMSGCSYFRITVAMCDPNDVNNMNGECRDYNEEEAEKSAYPKSHITETQSKESFDEELKQERKSEK